MLNKRDILYIINFFVKKNYIPISQNINRALPVAVTADKRIKREQYGNIYIHIIYK